ncbi:FlgO family outer membrane protein [Balneatrix alpica]|uniref:FlgO family outer membrane protein n=1 Tax=Balneatrix alpica TaxID=75684 RepID=A0ABV5ZFK6_9GAMM|nr:FlgO family outer membrane protein [Balneatrix alpica]
MRKLALIGLASAALLLTGCQSNEVKPQQAATTDLVATAYAATDALVKQLASQPNPGQTVLVASFVNVDKLEESSTLGRILAEQMASGLTRQGLPVVELKMRDSLFIQQNGGEFMLSRELQHLSQTHQAQAVLVGTYAVGRQHVYVSSRLVRASDNRILAGEDFRLPMDADVRALVDNRRR